MSKLLDLTLKDIRETDIDKVQLWKDAYQKWKLDDTRAKRFIESKQEIRQPVNADFPRLVLIDAFIYYPPPGKNSLIEIPNDDDGDIPLTIQQKKYLKSLPFVRILYSDNPEEIMTIYTVDDKLAYIRYNEEHRKWFERKAANPSLEDQEPRPPKFLSGWGEWSKFQYTIDKFKEGPDMFDLHTFLIPINRLKTKSLL
jgi:hypothetical protein